MPLLEQKALTEKNVFKLLKKSVKKIISENGIDTTTKKGNKELDYLLQKLAKFHFSSPEQVQNQGEKIAQVIVAFSKERNKTFLDQGVIQYIILKEEIPLVTETATVKPSVNPEPEKTTAQSVVSSKKAPVSPTPPVDEEDEEINVLPEAVAEADEEEEIDVTPETVAEAEADEETEENIPLPEATIGEIEDDEDEKVTLTPQTIVDEDEDEEEDITLPEATIGEIEDDEGEEAEITTTPQTSVDEEKPVKTEKSSQVEASKNMAATSLKDRIGEDIKTAMKAQDKIRLETVRGIKKVLIEREVAVRPSGQDSLTPEQEIDVLTQQAKQRRESIEQYTKAGRDDLAAKEAQELAIIETYLPEQLSDEELKEIIDEIITSVGAKSVKDLGKVMGVAMKQLKGQADGKKIQEMVKSQLG